MRAINIQITQEAISYRTLNHINQNIKFFGLSSLQMMFFLVIIIFAFLLKIIAGIICLAIIFILIKKLDAEKKKGNTDFLGSLLTFQHSPKKVIDERNILKYLIKQ